MWSRPLTAVWRREKAPFSLQSFVALIRISFNLQVPAWKCYQLLSRSRSVRLCQGLQVCFNLHRWHLSPPQCCHRLKNILSGIIILYIFSSPSTLFVVPFSLILFFFSHSLSISFPILSLYTVLCACVHTHTVALTYSMPWCQTSDW